MEERLKKIRAFLFDVDGVLTDGGILATLDGELLRTFDSKDGFALRMAEMHGYHLGIITGGRSESIRKRVRTCGIPAEDVYLGSRDKMEDFKDFCCRHNISAEEVMYFGDDLPDGPVMLACGCGVCPSDAVEDIKAIADLITEKPGGKGCVRECIEKVMKLQGEWQLDIQDYKRKY
jgi:3-deoxy-D-manno-octulosonate 8-phosphate phosphatase (KDO 8-P phosphatase)